MQVRLADIAHARSGDKADWVDFGLLQGGGARNLRLDNLGKAMAAALLRMTVEVSEAELARCRHEPRVGWWPQNPHDDPLAAQ